MRHISTVAVPAPNMRDASKAPRRKPWGFLLHTTGRGVVTKADATGKSPLDVALSVYRSSQRDHWGGAHYLIDHDGTIYQMAPDDVIIAHCGKVGARGIYRTERDSDPTWHQSVSLPTVRHWLKQWEPLGFNDPFDLFPSTSPNVDFVGAEMITVGSGFGEPMFDGALHTEAQHDAAVVLARDLAKRHEWPGDWHRTSRLCGHEDVQPIARHDRKGGWDVGWLRDKPYFNFEYVRSSLDLEAP